MKPQRWADKQILAVAADASNSLGSFEGLFLSFTLFFSWNNSVWHFQGRFRYQQRTTKWGSWPAIPPTSCPNARTLSFGSLPDTICAKTLRPMPTTWWDITNQLVGFIWCTQLFLWQNRIWFRAKLTLQLFGCATPVANLPQPSFRRSNTCSLSRPLIRSIFYVNWYNIRANTIFA